MKMEDYFDMLHKMAAEDKTRRAQEKNKKNKDSLSDSDRPSDSSFS